MTADSEPAVFAVEDFLGICYLAESKFLGDLRSYLGGVTVDSLASAYDYVGSADFL